MPYPHIRQRTINALGLAFAPPDTWEAVFVLYEHGEYRIDDAAADGDYCRSRAADLHLVFDETTTSDLNVLDQAA